VDGRDFANALQSWVSRTNVIVEQMAEQAALDNPTAKAFVVTLTSGGEAMQPTIDVSIQPFAEVDQASLHAALPPKGSLPTKSNA
jgi:hypothetical protein